jgi:hypothetical protein
MIGKKLTDPETGATYEVVAQNGGVYILAQLDTHAAPFEVSAAALSARFKVEPDPSDPINEQDGWEALAAANERGILALARGEVERKPTVEEVFAAHAAKANDGNA